MLFPKKVGINCFFKKVSLLQKAQYVGIFFALILAEHPEHGGRQSWFGLYRETFDYSVTI